MGNKQALSQSEVNELCNETQFGQAEVKRIYKRFIALDKYNRGYITVQDVMAGVPEIENNPLGERICKVFT
jgi:Ca2+-binding EF-hand superfamily protein